MLLPLTYKSITVTMIALVLLFLTLYPYVQAETLTNIHQQTFDINKICKVLEFQDFRSFKIINYEKQRNTSQLYCLYKDYKQNSIVTLYYTDKEGWLVEYTRNYKKDIGFFWPIYY
jgi:hypothetical protein